MENVFLKEGYKTTKQRQEIIKILKNSNVPLSAEDIFMSIKHIYPLIALSTVYRNLEIMHKKGVVRKNIWFDGKARYELIGSDHKHYLYCTKCNKVITLNVCPLGSFETKLKDEIDFEILGHNLEIYGCCSDCKK